MAWGSHHISHWPKFKRMLGLLLFWLSWLLWALVLAMPFVLNADVTSIAMVSTSLLVAAELSFIVSLLLLGRPFYQAIKQRLKSILFRIKDKE
ncbi:MAG: transporter suffix domain-containing protein [Mariprofundus sp.]|nr:transporter suffix domain-containing protein [Mariprofundus sp.]